MEVCPRFPMPCHQRRNGRGQVNFHVQPVLDGGKVLFFCSCLRTFLPIALPLSFDFFFHFIAQCILRNSVECDIGVFTSCSFLSQSVGHFISVDFYVCLDPREFYLPFRALQDGYSLSDFFDKLGVVVGVLQRIQSDFAVGKYGCFACVDIRSMYRSYCFQSFDYGQLFSLVVRTCDVQFQLYVGYDFLSNENSPSEPRILIIFTSVSLCLYNFSIQSLSTVTLRASAGCGLSLSSTSLSNTCNWFLSFP